MASMPPIGASNYPRPALMPQFGTADKLEALGEGYFGLSSVFALNFIAAIGVYMVSRETRDPFEVLGMAAAVLLIVGVASYFPNRKIAFGMGWASGSAVLASICISFFSWFCFGVLGYAIIQSIAAREIRRYGIKPGLLGIKKPVLKQAVEQLRLQEANQATVFAAQNTQSTT
jgi:hypothetical protein